MHTTLAGLEVEIVQRGAEPPGAAVILCHGFGAPGDDLVPLGAELLEAAPALSRTRFYFPAAPLALGEFGFGDSRAWWLIDVAKVQQLAAAGPEALREFRRVEPPGMAAARKALHALVQQVADQTGLPLKRIVLGGFSQGAMLATDVALRLEEAPGALVALSGTLLLEDVWAKKAAARAGLPVFQSHGRQDPLLPFGAAEALRDVLTTAGLDLEFAPFDGGHTIGLEVLTKLADFLSRQVSR